MNKNKILAFPFCVPKMAGHIFSYPYKFIDYNEEIKKEKQLYLCRVSNFQCRPKTQIFAKAYFSNLSSTLICNARLAREILAKNYHNMA